VFFSVIDFRFFVLCVLIRICPLVMVRTLDCGISVFVTAQIFLRMFPIAIRPTIFKIFLLDVPFCILFFFSVHFSSSSSGSSWMVHVDNIRTFVLFGAGVPSDVVVFRIFSIYAALFEFQH